MPMPVSADPDDEPVVAGVLGRDADRAARGRELGRVLDQVPERPAGAEPRRPSRNAAPPPGPASSVSPFASMSARQMLTAWWTRPWTSDHLRPQLELALR